jgi:hypothetical protein
MLWQVVPFPAQMKWAVDVVAMVALAILNSCAFRGAGLFNIPGTHGTWRDELEGRMYVAYVAALRVVGGVPGSMHQRQVRLAAEQGTAAMPADQQLWTRLAEGVATEDGLRAFFRRRQTEAPSGTAELTIAYAVKIVNRTKLNSFISSTGRYDVNPLAAHTRNGDAMLFHGTPEYAIANIQAEGLSMHFASQGMLGRGLYGAPDPRKSVTYCRNSPNGKFMFVCRYNLSNAKHAGPQTAHRNTDFNEFCVADDRHVVALWLVKLH